MTREEDIRNAVETMRRGGVILYPTDTVWGIGCDATNVEAVKRVYQIKQRDDSKALICLVDSDARLQRYFRTIPDVAWQLIDSLQTPGDGSFLFDPIMRPCCQTKKNRPQVFDKRSDGVEINISAPCCCKKLRSRKPQRTEIQGRPLLRAVWISTSLSPT